MKALSEKQKRTMQTDYDTDCQHLSTISQDLRGALGTFLQTCLTCEKSRVVGEWS